MQRLRKDVGLTTLRHVTQFSHRRAALLKKAISPSHSRYRESAAHYKQTEAIRRRDCQGLCENSRHRTARVSKRMPFGAKTVALRHGARERTRRPIFRQNARHFTWFPSPGTRAATGAFTQTRQGAVLSPFEARLEPTNFDGQIGITFFCDSVTHA